MANGGCVCGAEGGDNTFYGLQEKREVVQEEINHCSFLCLLIRTIDMFIKLSKPPGADLANTFYI